MILAEDSAPGNTIESSYISVLARHQDWRIGLVYKVSNLTGSGITMPFSLDNRVALVTGSSRGLGKAIAMMLGRLGAKVAINYANDAKKKGEDTFAESRGHGYLGTLARADVTDPNEIRQKYETTRRELGPVEILVCNATCDQPLKPVEQYDWDFCQRLVNFFIKSPFPLFPLTQICMPHMKGQRWGRIINVTSEDFDVGMAPFTAYVAAKGG